MNRLAKLILSPWIRNSWKLGLWNIGRWTIYLYIRTWWKNNYARKSRCHRLAGPNSADGVEFASAGDQVGDVHPLQDLGVDVVDEELVGIEGGCHRLVGPKIYIGSPTSKATVYISGFGLAKNGLEISTVMSQDDLRLVS